jgi:hypothetical protein
MSIKAHWSFTLQWTNYHKYQHERYLKHIWSHYYSCFSQPWNIAHYRHVVIYIRTPFTWSIAAITNDLTCNLKVRNVENPSAVRGGKNITQMMDYANDYARRKLDKREMGEVNTLLMYSNYQQQIRVPRYKCNFDMLKDPDVGTTRYINNVC